MKRCCRSNCRDPRLARACAPALGGVRPQARKAQPVSRDVRPRLGDLAGQVDIGVCWRSPTRSSPGAAGAPGHPPHRRPSPGTTTARGSARPARVRPGSRAQGPSAGTPDSARAPLVAACCPNCQVWLGAEPGVVADLRVRVQPRCRRETDVAPAARLSAGGFIQLVTGRLAAPEQAVVHDDRIGAIGRGSPDQRQVGGHAADDATRTRPRPAGCWDHN